MNPFLNASWISPSKQSAAPILQRRFHASHASAARLHITGLGYFHATLNGKPVSADRFVPAFSDVERREFHDLTYPLQDEMAAHRTYYLSYDVSALLQEGENVLEIQLAGGFYSQHERVCEGKLSFGERLRAIYALELTEESGERYVVSDGTERWRQSEIVFCELFLGEVHDARLRAEEQVWLPVDVLPAPESTLCPQTCPPDRLIRVLHPVRVGEKDGRTIYDAGENVSSVVRVRTHGAAGETIRLRFAEILAPDGSLDFRSTGSDYVCGSSNVPQIMNDCFICGGGEQVFEPRFVWHAFRYFDVEGTIDDCEVLVIHADIPVSSRFTSGAEGLNWLYDAFLRTQLNNMHGGVPSDCPHRERLGYTGDGQACAAAVMQLFDAKSFYKKWIRDIYDCQDVKSGRVQHTAPFMGGGGGPGGWGCAMILVPYDYWKQYGETDVLLDGYEGMKKWIGYLLTRCEDGLVVREADGGWCLGDWCPLGFQVTIPDPLVNTAYLVKSLERLAEIAEGIGRGEDAPLFQRMADEHRAALQRAYFDETTGDYANGEQGANAYALWVGLGDERTAARLAAKYDALGHFDTGFLGTDILLEQLFRTGHAKVAYRLLTGKDEGSFLYMKRHGATTLWETWEGNASHDHPMFGACVRRLPEYVLGIRQAEGSHGWEKVVLDPAVDPDVGFAAGSIQTPRGEIYVRWEYVDGKPVIETRLPAGVQVVQGV